MLRVTLFERPGCHLCEDAQRVLERIGRGRPLAVARVDISADPELEARYLLRIPVVAVGGRELDAAGLAEGEIAVWLARVEA